MPESRLVGTMAYRLTNLAAAASCALFLVATTLLLFNPRWNEVLHSAASLGDLEAVKTMIGRGADVNASVSPFGRTALHAAARSGDAELLRFLIASGADVNARDMYGGTPIFDAIGFAEFPDAVEVLIEAGADVNARTDGGLTPLDTARQLEWGEVERLLESNGAVPGITGEQ